MVSQYPSARLRVCVHICANEHTSCTRGAKKKGHLHPAMANPRDIVLRGMELIDTASMDELGDVRLRTEIVTPATVAQGETPLAPHEQRMIIHPSPVWYIAGDGSLAPIDTRIDATTEENASVWRADANTVQFRVRESGAAVYRAAGHELVVTPVRRATKLPGEVELSGLPANTPITTTAGERGTVQRGVWQNTRVQHDIFPGKVKETIWLDQQPPGLLGATWLSVVFAAQSATLTPTLLDGDIHWQSGGVTILRWPAPIVTDSTGTEIAAEYSIREGKRVALIIDAPALMMAQYPVAIDPTTTTGAGDGTAGRSIRTSNSLRKWKAFYYQVDMPDMTGNTVTGAQLEIDAASNEGVSALDYYARATSGTGAWSDSSGTATLDALSMGTAISTGNSITGTGWKYLDIFGDSGKGVSKFYTDDITGGSLTFAMKWSGWTGSLSAAASVFYIGEEVDSPYAIFTYYTDGTSYPRITLTYTSGASDVTGTGSLSSIAPVVSGTGATTHTGAGSVSGVVGTLGGVAASIFYGVGDIAAPTSAVSALVETTSAATGAVTSPIPIVAGIGEVSEFSGDVTGTGALSARPPRVSSFSAAGKTGSGAASCAAAIISGSGMQTVFGTGAITAPVPGSFSGTGINSPPNIAGTSQIAGIAPTVAGDAFALDPSAIDGDSLSWYLSGATQDGETQRHPEASLGGYRSGQLAEFMSWDCSNPMVGIEIVAVSGGNGRGSGSLEAVTEDSVRWAPPGGSSGTAVTITNGSEATLYGFESGAWIKIKRFSDIPLEGIHSVTCIDCYNNLFANVPSADAVAGEVYYRALIGKNTSDYSLATFLAWVDPGTDGSVAIAIETPSSGAIQAIANENTAPTGLTWSTGSTPSTGLSQVAIGPGETIGLWMRITVAADTAPEMTQLLNVKYQYTNSILDFENAVRGRYRIARDDYVMDGVWVGQDEAPDLSLDPDETFTSTPHTTALALTSGHTYYCVRRTRNKYGAWSQNSIPTPLRLATDGGVDPLLPTSPTDIAVSQNSSDEVVVTAMYEPAGDASRAEIFVVWFTADETAPDPDIDTPAGYALMDGRAGIEILNFTDSGTAQLDGTPIEAIVRTRRVVVEDGDSFSPDTTQLGASGGGTIVVASELSNWASSGFLKTTDLNGSIIEIVAYSSLVVGGGISTFTVDAAGRAQWGTSAVAMAPETVIYEVSSADSNNTDTVPYTVDALVPGRPWGDIFFGYHGKQTQSPIAGPDGVTKEYIDQPNNVYMLLGEGWSELWINTTLAWKVYCDSNSLALQTVYIPSEWDLVASAVSGAPTSGDVFETGSATSLYVVSGGVRRAHIDAAAMTITAAEFSVNGDVPDVAPQSSTWEQYEGSLVQVWDPGRADYRPYMKLTSAGAMQFAFDLDNSATQIEVEALP